MWRLGLVRSKQEKDVFALSKKKAFSPKKENAWLLTFMQAKRQLAINILAHNSNNVLVGRGNVAYQAQARQHFLLPYKFKKALMTFQIMRAPWKLMETLQMTDKECWYLGKWFEVSCRGLGLKKRVSWGGESWCSLFMLFDYLANEKTLRIMEGRPEIRVPDAALDAAGGRSLIERQLVKCTVKF